MNVFNNISPRKQACLREKSETDVDDFSRTFCRVVLFMSPLIYSILPCFFSLQALTDEMLTELKSCFLEAYDDNQDGKIDIRELAQLLPMEENFLLLFRFDNPLESSVEFMKIWREYDSDNSGYIEADELKVWRIDVLVDIHLLLL